MNTIQKAFLSTLIGTLFFVAPAKTQIIEIEESKQKFGFVREGELVQLEYKFKNTGKAPLIFSDYKVACSCTKVVFPENPILQGQSGILKVSFDTQGKLDRQDRTIQLISNAENGMAEIRFKGVVLKAKNEN